jgi:hypothetical protein
MTRSLSVCLLCNRRWVKALSSQVLLSSSVSTLHRAVLLRLPVRTSPQHADNDTQDVDSPQGQNSSISCKSQGNRRDSILRLSEPQSELRPLRCAMRLTHSYVRGWTIPHCTSSCSGFTHDADGRRSRSTARTTATKEQGGSYISWGAHYESGSVRRMAVALNVISLSVPAARALWGAPRRPAPARSRVERSSSRNTCYGPARSSATFY